MATRQIHTLVTLHTDTLDDSAVNELAGREAVLNVAGGYEIPATLQRPFESGLLFEGKHATYLRGETSWVIVVKLGDGLFVKAVSPEMDPPYITFKPLTDDQMAAELLEDEAGHNLIATDLPALLPYVGTFLPDDEEEDDDGNEG